MTAGAAAGTPAIGGYVSLTAEHYGRRAHNYAISGTRTADWAFYQFQSGVSIDSTVTVMSIFGVGDAVAINSDPTVLAAWKFAARANLLYGAIADADKVKAGAAGFTKVGTWSAISTGFSFYDTWGGRQTSTAGDNATATVSGTVGYLISMAKSTNDVSFDVSIDGVSQGTFSNVGNSTLTNFAGLNTYPMALRFTGLAAGAHTLKVTYNSGTTPLQLMWAGGNAGTSGKPRYIAGTCIPELGNANASQVASMGTALSAVTTELLSDGLKVYLWDANAAMPTAQTYLWADGLHPTTIGHYTLSVSAIAVTDAHP